MPKGVEGMSETMTRMPSWSASLRSRLASDSGRIVRVPHQKAEGTSAGTGAPLKEHDPSRDFLCTQRVQIPHEDGFWEETGF